MRFWVGLRKLGLGFRTGEERRAAREKREERETRKKMKGIRVKTFYISAGPGGF